ncbi:Rad52/Rad22 family DNA repair protein [Desertibacillus haloalkaliphilus]|uniref:Rad52/Rad22 family DNA repair protein n=1 Tax=Desertibacillus haloalkaliphilus TaxID=1328930 RepID=UPI001C2774E8|nr:Rad52/Rad22 family DNA repair protein [Desertibacillus haloalkaliphilus]MBU8908084.1 hypothetical protein [Desertibacillus haloalkaliphilus]
MMTNEEREIMQRLQEPFPAEDVEWRVQRTVKTKHGYKAIVCAYLTNRAIQNRLDEVVGPFNWKNEYREWREKGVLCGISINVGDEWITKWDGSDETSIESTKGGLSNSMKRAAVQFSIGRYLYQLDEQWVPIKDKGDHYINTKVKVRGQEEWVTGYWDTPQLPGWALPQRDNVDPNHAQSSNSPSEPVHSNRGKDVELPTREMIEYTEELERTLDLNDAERLDIFSRTNQHVNVHSVSQIYQSSKDDLSRYVESIRYAALIKKEVDVAEVPQQVILNWLSENYGTTIESFKNLCTVANKNAFEAVKQRIAKEQEVA